MDRAEKLAFQQSIENYFEEKRVYYLFEKLLKELVIIKPKDPIDFLIKRLKTPDTKRIFITGNLGTNRKEISLSIANHLGYEGISTGDILSKEISKRLDLGKKIEPDFKICKLVKDEIVVELIKQELIRLEKANLSYIVEGFPRNRVQAMFLQSVGIIPDNMIILSNSKRDMEQRVYEKISQNYDQSQTEYYTKNALDEYELNMKSIKEIFPYHSLIDTSQKNLSSITEDLSRIIKLKNKTFASRKPPRILLLGPPCSRKSDVAKVIAKKYNIVHISISDLLNAEIKNSNDSSKEILAAMNKGELVEDKYVHKLLENRLFASDAMINGWIITGFPKNSAQLRFIETEYNKSFKPSLIVVIETDDEFVSKRSKMRRIDPYTGKSYYLDSQEFDPKTIDERVMQRLEIKTEDKDDVLKKRLESWKSFNYSDLNQNGILIRINGENSFESLVENISDALENDS